MQPVDEGVVNMEDSSLRAQIKRDSEAVSRISVQAQESYKRELRATIDRGAFYNFSSKGVARS